MDEFLRCQGLGLERGTKNNSQHYSHTDTHTYRVSGIMSVNVPLQLFHSPGQLSV